MRDVSTILRRPRSKLERVVDALCEAAEPPPRPALGLLSQLVLLVLVGAGAEPTDARAAALRLSAGERGLAPDRLASAEPEDLPPSCAPERAGRALEALRALGRLALETDDLDAACGGDRAEARALLGRIPGLGEHRIDLALLYAGLQPLVAPTPAALQVALRLGYPGAAYGAVARALDAELDSADASDAVDDAWRAHHALDRHGKTLCVASSPRCDRCPVAAACVFRGEGEDPAAKLRRPSAPP